MKEVTWSSFLSMIVVVLVTGRIEVVAFANLTDEARLIRDLTTSYDPRARPRINATEHVEVTLAFYLTRIDDLSMRSEMLSVSGWLVMKWQDDLLSWNPADYNNITKIVLPTSSVWLPMIALDNSILDVVEKKFVENFSLFVFHTGLVSWEPAGVFATSCEIEILFYPFDHQTCKLTFSTWDYTQDLVRLTHASSTVNMEAYVENGEWDIVFTNIYDGTFNYDCCPENVFPEVSVSIHMRRKSLYYFINILIPCLMMSALVLMVFYLPPDSGEKVSLGVTVLLAFSVFQLMIAEDMPTSASATPILEVYLLCFMSASIFSVVISVLVLNLHHRTEYTPPPTGLRWLVLDHLGHWLCMGTRKKRNAVRPLTSPVPDTPEKVEAKIDIEAHVDPGAYHSNPKIETNIDPKAGLSNPRIETHIDPKVGHSNPRILLANSPVESTDDFTGAGFLGASGQNLTAGTARSTVRLIQSIANFDKLGKSESKSESKTAFLRAVREVYQELYQTRITGEVEAALENEWKLIARVVDRFFFWVTFTLLIVSSAVIFGIIPAYEKHSTVGPTHT